MKYRLSVIITVLVCVVCGLLFFPIPHKAQIPLPYYVTTTSDNVVAGACQAGVINPGCSLRGAIQRANEAANNDLILFDIPASDPFCPGGVCTINLTQALPTITGPVSISGPGADKLTVKPATSVNVRVFNIATAGTVSFFDLTISNGMAVSSVGGAIRKISSGTLNVTNCTLRNNQAGGGAGLAIEQSTGAVNVTNSTISGNTTSGGGGGIANDGNAPLNVINSTISGNTSSGTSPGGGGISNFGTMNVTNSTISGNNSGGASGGGIYNFTGGTFNVKNSIVALNTATSGPDANGNFVSAGFNLIGKRDGSTGFTAATDITGTIAAPLNPMLDPAGLQNNGGTTSTIRLLPGSPAIDKGTSNGLTGNLTTDQRGTGFPRTFDDPAIANAAGGNGTDIGAFERGARTPFDFDGDGKTDISVFRPGPAEWYLNRSTAGFLGAQFGQSTDKVTAADFTGDGKTDIAFFRPSNGNWFILRSENSTFFAFPFGQGGDIPAPGDFDGDGRADAAVYRPSISTWFILRSSDGGVSSVQFGISSDQPVPSDYDGDGKADIAVWRSGPGEWWILKSSNSQVLGAQFGQSTDKPTPGDFTGDGKSDRAFWRPSDGNWFILRSEDSSFFAFPFGQNGDKPAPGDYDGDGRFDAAVFRPTGANWFINKSSGGVIIQQFGISTDVPVPGAYLQ